MRRLLARLTLLSPVVLPIVLPSTPGRWLRARSVLLAWGGIYLVLFNLNLPVATVGTLGGLLWLAVIGTVLAHGLSRRE